MRQPISVTPYLNQGMRERFWSKVRLEPNGCMAWTASTCGEGYGQFFVRKGISESTGRPRPFMALAHRAAYEMAVGFIPPGMTIDHLCENKLCVNTAHMEVVTQKVNAQRGMKNRRVKTTCPQGHPYDRVYSWVERRTGKRQSARGCSICKRAHDKERQSR